MEDISNADFDDIDDDFLSTIPLDDESLHITPTAIITDESKATHPCKPANLNILQPISSVSNTVQSRYNIVSGRAKSTPTTTGKCSSLYFDNASCSVLDFEKQGPVQQQQQSNLKDKENVHQETQLEVPSEFPFPFEPYDIQVGFMQNLYRAIDERKIGIFESPTGTGKSLSLICGALRWLKDFEDKQRKELDALLAEQTAAEEEREEKKEELDWIAAFVKKKEDDEKSKKLKESRETLARREERMKQLRGKIKPRHSGGVKRKRHTLEDEFDELFKGASEDLKAKFEADMTSQEGDMDEADDNLVAEYVSDDEKPAAEDGNEAKKDESEDDDHITKIYYCSRTHSQIAQFVREVMKSPYGGDTRVVSLGSRQNLCINASVRRLKHVSLMNDRCLEMQKNKSGKKQADGEKASKRRKTAGTCPFYKQDPMMDFRDSVLVDIKDIEQLVQKGRDLKACPYYGTRYAVPAAEIVALPYNTLLHKSTRESCGIKVKDNILIIDEAHNLVDTISSVHSACVTGNQVTCAHSQLTQYMSRYQSRLKAKNLMYIRQILFILASFVKCLGGQTGTPAEEQKLSKSETKLQTINDFLFATKLDNLNLFKILRYCEKSQIAKKLHGFVEKYQPSLVVKKEVSDEKPKSALSNFLQELSSGKLKQGKAEEANTSEATANEQSATPGVSLSSPLMQITAFLQALTNTDKDGRIVVAKQDLVSTSSLKFLLLNPAVHFAELVQDARAVIVAGGTMQPLSEFKDQLFYATGVSPERILEYSCGHVIPDESLLPVALGRGPSGHLLDFTYQSRDTTQTLDELGRVVYNVCHVVPGGVVVFFPSYEYERLVHSHWHKHGYLDKIAAKKKIFREPKKTSQVDSVLSDYGTCIKKHLGNKYSALTGAVLFSVVGGKMSEGINFSDDLGRCVIMVGLPYPNIKSPELKEKMDYLNANMPKAIDGRLPGQVHYENLCMKAVNQSIGRAIRHKGDYACILLADHRYLKPSMKTKLSSWISASLQPIDRFGPAFAQLRKFFASKKSEEST